MVFDRSSPMGKVQFQNRKVITFKYKQIKKEVTEFTGHTVRQTNSPFMSKPIDRGLPAVILDGYLNMDI